MTALDEDSLSEYFSRIGRKGGYARAKALTPQERKISATKASAAAAKARQKKKAKHHKPRSL
jgi:hypothetical protein